MFNILTCNIFYYIILMLKFTMFKSTMFGTLTSVQLAIEILCFFRVRKKITFCIFNLS